MNEIILSRLNRLPDELKAEIFGFIETVVNKHEKKIQEETSQAPIFSSCKGLFIPDDSETVKKTDTSSHINDPWANPDMELPSVDTGIEDFSINHDHYLYGTSKIS